MTNPPIHHQSANPSPICQSTTNLSIHHQSTNQMSIHHQSANPMSIHHQSASPMSILDQSINPSLRQINKYDTNQLSISCQFSVNLPIQYQSATNQLPIRCQRQATSQCWGVNPSPIQCQSIVNRCQSSPNLMPMRRQSDHNPMSIKLPI